ncbi:hypothetical protein [Rhizobium ruizarguesonis]|uniref:hypothetical protein n=1 Tax=Rhizobium ruizarguesonis TaxID=2081791 RepID=UPI00103086A3|nr:hypothetical protein [Rhizobium ruizarguesonis]TAT84805.1 hypothetical protein ELI52_15525 [Rhizobium ruizarguesonis]
MIPGHESAELPADEWMVHFVCARNELDRGLNEHEGGIPLPSDGELSAGADEFEVLCAQLRFGGLIPWWPDGIGRRYSPRPTIVAQTASRIDFSVRESIAGIAFLRDEFVNAGAGTEVIHGRPDLCFSDLLAWDARHGASEFIRFLAPNGVQESALGLSLYLPRTPFSAVKVLVDDAKMASRVRELLTRRYLGLRSYEPASHYIRRRLQNIHVLCACGEDEDDTGATGQCPVPGLQRFSQQSAVVATHQLLRYKVKMDWAIEAARYAAGHYHLHPGQWDFVRPELHQSHYVSFVNDGGPASTFLIRSGMAEIADEDEDEWRLDIGIDLWCQPADQLAMFKDAAKVLTSALDLWCFVRTSE